MATIENPQLTRLIEDLCILLPEGKIEAAILILHYIENMLREESAA